MKRLLFLLPVGAIAAFLAAASAPAAPSPVSIGIGPKAELVSQSELLLPVTYNCPTTAGEVQIFANVFEQSTGGIGFAPLFLEPCTGSNTTAVLDLTGGPFTLDKAFATATVIGAGTFQTDQRQIQITL